MPHGEWSTNANPSAPAGRVLLGPICPTDPREDRRDWIRGEISVALIARRARTVGRAGWSVGAITESSPAARTTGAAAKDSCQPFELLGFQNLLDLGFDFLLQGFDLRDLLTAQVQFLVCSRRQHARTACLVVIWRTPSRATLARRTSGRTLSRAASFALETIRTTATSLRRTVTARTALALTAVASGRSFGAKLILAQFSVAVLVEQAQRIGGFVDFIGR
jgi:hypothetical protein